MYTLGEDMALALEIQKAGWKGAYVKEYMAVGEVPETIRNAFMQVHAWVQGPEQQGEGLGVSSPGRGHVGATAILDVPCRCLPACREQPRRPA